MSGMDNIIATTVDGKCRVRLVPYEGTPSPRVDQDNLTHVITPDQSDYLPVDENGGPLQYGWDYYSTRPESEALFIRWARIYHGAVVIEHRPVREDWSLWYLMPDKAAENGSDPVKVIEDEIKEYQAWADGEVFGYVVEEATDWDSRDGDRSMTTWEEVDCCWGYIGREQAEGAARDALGAYGEVAK